MTCLSPFLCFSSLFIYFFHLIWIFQSSQSYCWTSLVFRFTEAFSYCNLTIKCCPHVDEIRHYNSPGCSIKNQHVLLLFLFPACSDFCPVASAWRSSSSLARSGLPLLAKQRASWEALGWCKAAGRPLLQVARTWKAWADGLSPARSFTSWAALRLRRRETAREATSSSESSPESQRRRESDR